MKRKNIISTIAMLAVTLMVSGCSGLTGGSDSSTEDTAIRVGSKDFTENLVVSEIYALALEDAGYEVERSRISPVRSSTHRSPMMKSTFIRSIQVQACW